MRFSGVALTALALMIPTAVYAANTQETERFKGFLEQKFQEEVDRSPGFQAQLGIKKDQDKWDDPSEARAVEDFNRHQQALTEMRASFKYENLSPEAQLSWRIFESNAKREALAFKFRNLSYVFDQMNGQQSQIPAFLINFHRIDNVEDAKAYIARLNGIKPLMDTLIDEAQKRERMGVLPPKWVFPYIISDAKNLLTGDPFTVGSDSAILADFKTKVAKLQLASADEKALIEQAETALKTNVAPAYQNLITLMEAQQNRASKDDGVWKLPEGNAYYAERLAFHTTTSMTADEIHAFGLAEVARIHGEMREIAKKVGFQGSLKEFFKAVFNDPKQFYDNTDAGRAAYIQDAQTLIADMNKKTPDYFGVLPKADLVVKRVESFREKSAGKAFYQRPSPDGSRPGTFYANLYNMKDMPRYQMAALVYHEGIPGHHLQQTIAGELKDVPSFRKWGRFTAYSEGWGLYSENLAKDMGYYQDPYSDFGRLSLELLRSVRLVADTGIHAKHWTREKAIQYMVDNTPSSIGEITKEVERYIVFPGQATAYKVGMRAILAEREAARSALGKKFDIRGFHDAVLKSGLVPLDVLHENISAWIAMQKAAK